MRIVNNDNTYTEISWRICILKVDTSPRILFNSALRQCISYQIKDFRYTSDLSYCNECNCSLYDKVIHIDHVIHFIKLIEDFMELNKEIIIPNEYIKKDITFQTMFTDDDKWIGEAFETYHLQHAKLRVLCEKCNLTRKKYKKI